MQIEMNLNIQDTVCRLENADAFKREEYLEHYRKLASMVERKEEKFKVRADLHQGVIDY